MNKTNHLDKPVFDLLSLSGRKAVVTGAGAGIGFAIAKRLAEAGASVLMTDINRESIEKAERRLVEEGYEVQAHVSDAGREEDIIALFKEVSGPSGGVDILVNNAGIYPHIDILDMTTEQWREVLRSISKAPSFVPGKPVDGWLNRGGAA